MIEIVVTISVALITAILGPIFVEWVKFKFQTKNQDPVKEAIEINDKIDNQLEQIMNELGCDRVWLSQFHNGGYFYPTGKSIQKFSIFYEKVATETSSIKEIYQNIPVSLFPKLLSELYSNGEIIFDEKEQDNLFSLSEHGSKFSYHTIITNENSQFIGLLSLSFKVPKKDLSEGEWEFTKEKAGIIGGMLNNYLSLKK